MRKVWESYYAEANAVVFVVDSADTNRVQDAKQAFTEACSNDILAHTPVIFIANKQDLPHAHPPAEIMAEVVGAGSGPLLIKGGDFNVTLKSMAPNIDIFILTDSQVHHRQ